MQVYMKPKEVAQMYCLSHNIGTYADIVYIADNGDMVLLTNKGVDTIHILDMTNMFKDGDDGICRIKWDIQSKCYIVHLTIYDIKLIEPTDCVWGHNHINYDA